ncbi:TetR/AcrR family transcriptional regulator [Chryseobacterium culicis]|uniref:TetR family transcriptional regulator n=1 Tax=Chryseobacterium culicis TaxID=680127 RepID=A0A2S9D040_CHRCI|nr:TetR/AcrR family transcriptional regulator [Chryseobacterium culicis]PRB86147.1 TetR family transcriptional regulator [Chryseobacterium culicis]PRB91900.1 TetR family transcriptional regulator [Chryseobacterium culicis]
MSTQQKIIDTAITVFNENFSATFEEIAEHCNLNRRTLHRYFKNRNELLEACNKNMMQAWENAAIKACNSSTDPLVQLENLLYAGIESGTKYAFLIKLNEIEPTYKTETGKEYLKVRNELFSTIQKLQKEELIDSQLPLVWIKILFTNTITATITAYRSGDIAPNEIKKLAWNSFSRSIGLQLNKQ